VIDIATKNVIATIPVGKTPLGIAVSPNGTHLYVANENSDSRQPLGHGAESKGRCVLRVGVPD
jgi:DNA-binding beta-propeller fold protein YncE